MKTYPTITLQIVPGVEDEAEDQEAALRSNEAAVKAAMSGLDQRQRSAVVMALIFSAAYAVSISGNGQAERADLVLTTARGLSENDAETIVLLQHAFGKAVVFAMIQYQRPLSAVLETFDAAVANTRRFIETAHAIAERDRLNASTQ